MSKLLEKEIEQLRRKIMALSVLVEEGVVRAIKALNERDEILAREVLSSDEEIDRIEVEIEEDCLKILALHQPVASDLRYIIAMLKINADLERIGDLAVNIAHRAKSVARIKGTVPKLDFDGMAKRVRVMLLDSLKAMIDLNPELARKVCSSDDEIDDLNRTLHRELVAMIQKHPDQAETLTYYMSVARNLERIGDHATNIAEDVIYLVEGDIVRHSLKLN